MGARGPNRQSEGSPKGCVSALLFYAGVVVILIAAIKHLAG